MQVYKNKDPYIQSTRLEIIKVLITSNLVLIKFSQHSMIALNLFFISLKIRKFSIISDIKLEEKIRTELKFLKRCLRIDEVHLSFSIQIPNCFLPGFIILISN